MRRILFIIAILFSKYSISQYSEQNTFPSRWEFLVGSGLYLDLFYANIGFGIDGSEYTPSGYPDKPGRRVNPGITNRLEIRYHLNKQSGLSFYFQNSRFNNLLGIGNDPLEVWKDLKRNNRRMHYTLNYFRIINSGKKRFWHIACGFQVQIEKVSFPYMTVDDPANPTAIIAIGAVPYYAYFEDWAIPLTVSHHWRINKNLNLGLMFNTAYTTGTGIDGVSLLGNIAIPFGNAIQTKKVKRINKQP